MGVDKIEVRGNTVEELIEALSANFYTQLKPTINKPRLACRMKGYDNAEDVYKQLTPEETEFHLYPMLTGGGGVGKFFKIIIGVILLVTFVVLTGPAGFAALAAGTATLTVFGTLLLTMGVGMLLGGLMDLLMPQPKIDLGSANDADASKYLGSAGNTVTIGTPIPLIFGRHRVYGHIISFNVDAVDVAVT